MIEWIRAELIADGHASKLLLDYIDDRIHQEVCDQLSSMIADHLEQSEESMARYVDKLVRGKHGD